MSETLKAAPPAVAIGQIGPIRGIECEANTPPERLSSQTFWARQNANTLSPGGECWVRPVDFAWLAKVLILCVDPGNVQFQTLEIYGDHSGLPERAGGLRVEWRGLPDRWCVVVENDPTAYPLSKGHYAASLARRKLQQLTGGGGAALNPSAVAGVIAEETTRKTVAAGKQSEAVAAQVLAGD